MSANPNLKQVSPASLDEIASKFNLLNDVEKQLPEDRRAAVIRTKLSHYFKRQEQIKAAQANAAANGTAQQPIPVDGATGNGGPARPLAPPQAAPNGGNMPVNMAQQQQHMQAGPPGGGQMGQSPRMGQMPQGQQQQQMNPGQQQVSLPPDVHDPNFTHIRRRVYQLTSQAYQEQMRLQQQHQQQAHLTDMMQKTQRMQQQQKQQIQAQAQQVIANQQQQQQNGTMMPPQHPNVAGHSPPNPAMVGSPHTSIGRSPSNPPRQTSTPVPTTNPAIRDQTKILMDNFPKLLELKRQGRLAAEQEKLVSVHLHSIADPSSTRS
jgi:hypothetical protein